MSIYINPSNIVKSFLSFLDKHKYKVIVLLAILAIVITTLFTLINNPWASVKDVRITNMTDGSATISWVTNKQTKGTVLYSEESGLMSFLKARLMKKLAYDDRDYSRASLEYYYESISNSESLEYDENGIENNIKLKDLDKYLCTPRYHSKS